ncbi:MAG: 3-phosphoshikimate 1-carboxyvinyltransferase [Bacteroidota bacterium]|jgi:3-phosphoshikimate 1-carboxyvinyltransferase
MSDGITLRAPSGPLSGEIVLPASKSVSNRVLIIRALSGGDFPIDNLSDADDTRHMLSCLEHQLEDERCGDGGTSFRFLLALRACQGKIGTLTAEGRMLERPVAPLVDALNALGADIIYTQGQGRAAVRFSGKPMKGGEIHLTSSISSQFLSALMLIAPYLPGGLTIRLEGNTVSKPYIDMTAALMREFGAIVVQDDNVISVREGRYVAKPFFIPPDWSAAAVFYAMVALRPGSKLSLSDLALDRYQGDRALATLMQEWGVQTTIDGHNIIVTSSRIPSQFIETDFSNNPDLAQVFAVIAAVANRPMRLTGLSTLRIKETDRIQALVSELTKAGAGVSAGSDFLEVKSGVSGEAIASNQFYSHNDHRMVMTLSLLSLCVPVISIQGAACISKSFPEFFARLTEMDFQCTWN